MQMFDYHEEECPWFYFDSSYKTLLGACLFVFGLFGVLLNGWLFATWLFGPACCQLFAFTNQFFGVFQMTALFVIVLERYVLAKHYRHEKKLHIRFYWTLIGVTALSAILFATPPLFGYGVYSCDSTGTSCTLLWPPLTSAKQIGFSIPYIIVCGVVPAATTIPVLCYLTVDERLRAALLGRMRKQYALLRPERAKKFYRS
ncbi:Visual pigment-like receptor peropsin [Operophtera brumata]|uniref:Visual pigment-like receptor peropsin n=1 Tax=Operophtera brumata TaxID=104452 RepID=A0A0L7LAK9_OPEBR|nr:Visual pigment-like receptor peropsin [Operophtera brumata]